MSQHAVPVVKRGKKKFYEREEFILLLSSFTKCFLLFKILLDKIKYHFATRLSRSFNGFGEQRIQIAYSNVNKNATIKSYYIWLEQMLTVCAIELES